MIKTIYAIEISGVCNFKCPYCPYAKHQRQRGYMEMKTLDRICELFREGKVEAHQPLHLHLFGEPMLHKDFIKMGRMVQRTVGRVSFSTNGTGIDFEIARRLAEIGFEYITVSPHEARRATSAYYILKAQGNNVNWHGGPDHNWAGQVDRLTRWEGPCEFERDQKAVVRWNGDVAVCCITDNGEGVVGSIFDKDILGKDLPEISLCKKCHLRRKGNGPTKIQGYE